MPVTRAAVALLSLCVLLVACSGRFQDLPDFAAIEDTAAMKQAFYDYLKPLVEAENTRVLEQRAELEEIRAIYDRRDEPGWMQGRALKRLAKEYEVEWDPADSMAVADALWLRIDVIPEALVLAQAAKESGWGRSRFAVEAYNLFGQWCYEPGCGLVPGRRAAGATHEVAAFDSVSQSVRRYMNNLNTHERYESLRSLRSQQRQNEQPITGAALAAGLLGYSERGQPYVDEVLAMMRRNKALL